MIAFGLANQCVLVSSTIVHLATNGQTHLV